MDNNILILFVKIGGVAGISLTVCYMLFKDIIAQKFFPKLRQEQAYSLLRMIITFTFLLGLVGIAAWLFHKNESVTPQKEWPSAFEDIRSAELFVSDVDDELLISVNDQPLKSVYFNQTPDPISITSLLHRGSNKLTFMVQNGKYGGCGAQVELHLNGMQNSDFNWKWSKEMDKACAECNCFTYNKTLYLK